MYKYMYSRCDSMYPFQVPVGRGHARAYDNQRTFVLRTHEDHRKDAEKALETGTVNNNV